MLRSIICRWFLLKFMRQEQKAIEQAYLMKQLAIRNIENER